jgi:membrane protein DedA with SNARE-associated domain
MIDWFNSLLAIATDAVAQNSLEAMSALFLVSALTEVGLPFPFVIDGALFITSYENGLFSFRVLFVILALVLGRVAGASVIFWLSRLVGESFINWLGKRLPKLKLSERMVWLNTKLRKRAPLAVAIARLTPGLLLPASIAAGYCGMRYYQFIVGILLASIIADGALVIIGFATKYGFNILGFTPATWMVVVVLAFVILLIWFGRWLWLRLRAHKKSSLKS